MKPVKYILLITLILFIFVFLVTLPGRLRNNNDNGDNSDSGTTPVSEATTASISTVVQNDTSAIVVGGEPEGTSTSSVTGDDSMQNDNTWAFYLINQSNPLPDNFEITTKSVYGNFEMDERCADYMINMIADAKTEGVNLTVVSAYRSIEKQQNLLDADTKMYEEQGYSHDEALKKAAQGVAIPGQSEHNAGLAADILSDEYVQVDSGFEKTEAFGWLDKNAYKYGFILRYPNGKESITGIEYEPWHYRFIGLSQAKKVKDSGLSLEEYFEQLQ